MTGPADHFCPACGTAQPAFPRYPWHLCADCLGAAVDGAGRALAFFNVSLSGGFAFRYADEGDEALRVCRGVLALVADRPVHVGEARFGGIVAQPVSNGPLADMREVFDLRRRGAARAPRPDRPEAGGRLFEKP